MIGMASQVLGEMIHMHTLDLSNNQLAFLPLDIRKCSSLTDLYVYGNPLKHPAMIRAQLPCLGSLKVHLEEVSNITYYNKIGQKARTHGNPLCTVGLEGGKSGNLEQQEETTCKVETDNPCFKQDFTLVIRDFHKEVMIRLHTRPLDDKRMVDRNAPITSLRGLNFGFPVLFALLYQLPLFNFFHHADVAACVQTCTVVSYQRQEDVVCMGDQCGSLVILLFGRLRLSQTQSDGHRQSLSTPRSCQHIAIAPLL